MDIGFEFLLPKEAKIPTIKFEQLLYEWQGKKNPQGQEENWFHHFRLTKSNVPEHIIPMLPSDFQGIQWQCISIIDGVENLINELSEDTKIPKKNDVLLNLLHSLVGGEKKWVIVFEPDYDCIDEVLAGDLNIAFHKIVDSLTLERKGFVLWYKNKS
jgi:hypothetical protein